MPDSPDSNDPTNPNAAPESLVEDDEESALVTEAELTTLQLALSFEMPAMIPSTGYNSGHIIGEELICADDAGVFAFDLRTGKLLRRVSEVPTSRLRRPPAGGYLQLVSATTTTGGQRVVSMPSDDAPPQITGVRGRILSWSSDYSEVALFDDGKFQVRRWPSLEIVRAVEGRHPTIDWEYRLLLYTDGKRHVIQPIDSPTGTRYLDFEPGGPQHVYPYFRDVVSINGTTLLALSAGWRCELIERRPEQYGALDYEHSADARGGLVAVADGRLQRRDFDWDTGMLSAPFIPSTRTRDDDYYDVSALWHRDLDVAVVDEETPVLRNLQNQTLVTFAPHSQPKQWFDGGRALLMTHPTEYASRLRVDVWRCAAK